MAIEQMQWYKDPQWWAIIAALLLGLAGIFQDWIRKLFLKPKLLIEFNINQPDCHKIAMKEDTGKFVHNTYYLKLRVKNVGNYHLEDMEAMVVELFKKGENDIFKKVEDFLPLNLVWANTKNQITKPKIQPGLYKFLAFGHISENEFNNLNGFGISSSNKIGLVLDVATAPNTGSHIIFPGEYKIKLIFAANNLKSYHKIYHLDIADEWTEDQNTMLINNIRIKESKSMS